MVVRRRAGRISDPTARRLAGTEEKAVTAFEEDPKLALYAPLVARAHPGARNSYEALDPVARCRVEIELVGLTGATSSQRRHALRRARRLIELSTHPHVCPVRSVLELPAGNVGLVVSYRSLSLADTIARGWEFAPAQVVNVGISVASALAAVHSAGMSHLALCSENVMLAPDGDVEVAGFATLVSGEARLAPLSEGTELVRHAAPEVLEGFAAGPAADVYSLGSLLYEMLSGQAPFEVLPGESAAAFALRVLAEPAPPLRGGIPGDLRELVASALAKTPSSRVSNSVECSAALVEIRERHGWPSDGLSVAGTRGGLSWAGRGDSNVTFSIEAAVATGAASSADADASLPSEDRSVEGPRRRQASRRALEPPLGGGRRIEPLPPGTRGQPQLPLKGPDEPLDALELLKPPTPAFPVIPESPSRADGDSSGSRGVALSHLGVGARWGRVSPARKSLAGASPAGLTAQVPAQGRPAPAPPRNRTAVMGGRGENSGPGHLPLAAKALIAAAAIVIAVAALVALGVV